MSQATETAPTVPVRRGRFVLFAAVPIVVLATMVVGFLTLLLQEGRDPSVIPSALIGQSVPAFELSGLPDRGDGGFASADIIGEPALINVFASWCIPCIAEHPYVTALAIEHGIPVYGIANRDEPADTTAWLARHGDPYTAVGVDLDNRVGLELGVYGVPETYIIDADGVIVDRIVGPMSPRILAERVLPHFAAQGG